MGEGGGALGSTYDPFRLDYEPGESTIDLFGRGHVLISPSQRWCDASPVEAHRLDVYSLEPEGAMLVRPDGFISWRSTEFRPDDLPA